MEVDEFTCNRCGGVFGKAWSDQEALLEALQHGHAPFEGEDGNPFLCGDCYEEFNQWLLSDDGVAATVEWIKERAAAQLRHSSAPDSHSEDTASDTSRDQTPENS